MLSDSCFLTFLCNCYMIVAVSFMFGVVFKVVDFAVLSVLMSRQFSFKSEHKTTQYLTNAIQ